MIAAAFDALDAWLRPFAEWLGTFALHSTVALGVTWVITRLWRQRALSLQDSLLRQALWLPLLSATLQHAVFGSPWGSVMATTPIEPVADFEMLVAALLDGPVALDTTPVMVAEEAAAVPWAGVVVAVAGVAALIGLSCLWRTWRRLSRILASRRPETDSRVLAAAATLATELGLQQSPHISRADGLATPIAFGLLRPEVCLPARAASLDEASLRAMLGHELAHLRRGDPAWMWVAAWIHALFPWQVLLLAVRRQWSRIVELRCDAEAAHHTSPTAVARCLLEVAEWLRPQPVRPMVALGMAARPSALRERVEAALQATQPPPVRRLLAGGMAAASLCALTFAAPGLQERSSDGFRGDAAGIAHFVESGDRDRDLDSMLQRVDLEYRSLVQEANQLSASLQAIANPRAALLQETLQGRLSNLTRLRARLLARLGRPVSGNR